MIVPPTFVVSLLLPLAQWIVKDFTNPETGEKKCVVIYPAAFPTRPLGSPHQNVMMGLGVVVEDEKNSVRLVFNIPPILDRGVWVDGFMLYPVQAKWVAGESEVAHDEYLFSADWGNAAMVLEGPYEKDEQFIQWSTKAEAVLVGIQWFDIGWVYYKFPLDGFAESWREARLRCASSK